jgi:tetratricopeptide (TPR) repeat protein
VAAVATDYNTNPLVTPSAVVAQADNSVANPEDALDTDFAALGEVEFKQGNYEKSVKAWRHAVVDDPQNGILVSMLGQALFATGKYPEAAGATQQALALLPQEKWGVVTTNYKELYSKVGDYTTQLRALEKASKEKPDDPALHFLLGYHYGYLGYPKEAVSQFDKVIAQAPQDQIAQKLRDAFAEKLKPATADQPSGNGAANVTAADGPMLP